MNESDKPSCFFCPTSFSASLASSIWWPPDHHYPFSSSSIWRLVHHLVSFSSFRSFPHRSSFQTHHGCHWFPFRHSHPRPHHHRRDCHWFPFRRSHLRPH